MHSIRFDYDYEYSSPLNTTSPLGLGIMVNMMTQIANTMLVQYYQNVEEKLKEFDSLFGKTPTPTPGGPSDVEDKSAFIRQTLWNIS